MEGSHARASGREDSNGLCKLELLLSVVLICCSLADAQQWISVTLPFPGKATTALLRTDGFVMVEDSSSGLWWLLVPDDAGNYSSGIWLLAGGISNYDPLYFASAVLPDSRVIVEGGEYNFGQRADSHRGAIFDERTGFWREVSPPNGWDKIGGAQSVVLPDGTFMLAQCCHSKEQALLDAKTLTWKPTGAGKADSNSEEGWTLLPNGKVLTIDTQNAPHSELYDPNTGKWSLTGDLPFNLTSKCGKNIVPEIGPAVLRPDGTVFATGGNRRTAVYKPSTGTWKAGPSFPKGFAVADGPAALLPNGNVLVMASPCFDTPSLFFEFDGSTLIPAPQPPNGIFDKSFHGRMVVLPNSHILFTDGSSDVEIYVPSGSPKTEWLPTITSHPSTVTRGKAYTVKGTQLNGLSQGAAYGDDAQSATNFPLVRFTNIATGHQSYARTKNFSTMGVATGIAIESATFIPSTSMEAGASRMVVVANGLASASVSVTVK